MSAQERLSALAEMDRVLGLDLASVMSEPDAAPAEVRSAVEEHRRARVRNDVRAADALRNQLDGWRVEDIDRQRIVLSQRARRLDRRDGRRISSGEELADLRAEVPTRSWSVCIVTREYPEDLERCAATALRWLPDDGEVLVLDQGSTADAARRAAKLGSDRVRVVLADRDLGEAVARNALLRISRGRSLLQLDPSVAITGNVFASFDEALRAKNVGAAGPWGLRAVDHLKQFDEVTSGACDAVQGYCFATRREPILSIGGFDARYRFYRNLDIATSLALRERGLASVAAGSGLATRHEHRAWERLAEDERQKRSRKNYDRLVRRFSSLGVGT